MRWDKTPEGKAWHSEYRRRRRLLDPEYDKKYTDINRRGYLNRTFGITPEQYQEMVEAQNGLCKLCGLPCSTGNRLAIDHNKSTGKNRDLLCMHCNQGIGKFKENPSLLRAAADYLERHAK